MSVDHKFCQSSSPETGIGPIGADISSPIPSTAATKKPITLRFCTENCGKIDYLRLAIKEKFGECNIVSEPFDFVEPQLDCIIQIAETKAKQAYGKLRCGNLIVHDAGLVIEALNDFPGPYTKYVMKTLGARGILKLMEGESNRRCGFLGCLCFVDAGGRLHSFPEPVRYWGEVAMFGETVFARMESCKGNVSQDVVMSQAAINWAGADPKHNVFSIFKPSEHMVVGKPYFGKTLLDMTPDELTDYRLSRDSCYRRFAEFLWESTQVHQCRLDLQIHNSKSISHRDAEKRPEGEHSHDHLPSLTNAEPE